MVELKNDVWLDSVEIWQLKNPISIQLSQKEYLSNELSWNCPKHVLGMGTCPEILGTESDDRLYFVHLLLSHLSAECLQTFPIFHMEQKNSHINQIF